MGIMIDGQWHTEDSTWAAKDGTFQRAQMQFRHTIGSKEFPAERNRYHLFVSLACPWAHRTLIFRQLKGLEPIIPITVVHPHMLLDGWQFSEPELLYGFTHLHQLYRKANPRYSGRVSVPLLWDKEQETIVNNESVEIIRIFNRAFDGLTDNHADYYPATLQPEINSINTMVYNTINNGVYRCGFATTQEAYEEAFNTLFKALDEVEQRLSQQRYLVGKEITEADWRLFTTLIRFDAVYFGHFKCNRNHISDMPNLWGYLRDLYQQPGIADTVDLNHIKQHYYYSHAAINPTRIVPKGLPFDFTTPHDRTRFTT